MSSDRKVHINVTIRSGTTTAEIVEWLHKLVSAVVGIPHIRRIVVLRFNKQIDTGESAQLNSISPQIACYQYIPSLRGMTHDSIGWWWNVGLHHTFNTMPYPDYVLHYPFDVDWSFGKGNTVVARNTLRGFIEAVGDAQLLIGTFSTSEQIDRATPEGQHAKDRIEETIRHKIREHFPRFNYTRPRSEFFIVERDFYYDFINDMSPDEFSDDLTIQFLICAQSKGIEIGEFRMGTYYVPPGGYTEAKEQEQVERIVETIEWARKKRFTSGA